jgi:hypothetical protein
MKTINFLTGVAIIALGFSVSSCKKDKVDAISSDTVVALQDQAQANDMLDDVDNEADDVVNGNSSLKSAMVDDTTILTGRVVVWTTNNDGTRTAVITYINFQNPLAKNERVKNGVIRIVVTGKRSENTYKRVVTFENFTINDNKIEGTKTIEKTADYVYKITMTDGKITFTDSSFITINYVRTRTMVEGQSTPLYIWDDAYTFEGSANGLTRKGEQYTREITIPIKVYTAYRFPVSGSFTFTCGDNTFTLDYGDGTMDDKATITKNGVSKEITLRK